MKIIYLTFGIISVILSLILSILPFGKLAFIPIITGTILTFLLYKEYKKEGYKTGLIKILFLGIIVSLAVSIYRAIFTENKVVETEKTIEKEKQSEEDAIKELESIDIDD